MTSHDGERPENTTPAVPEPPDASSEKPGLGCACCFEEYPQSSTTCSNPTTPHTFCFSCARKNAESEMGKGKSKFLCMDASGCNAPFEESEIRRFLEPNAFAAFDKLRTTNDIREAAIYDLIECPFCPYAAIVGDPKQLTFKCERPECRIISCRKCREKSHPKMTCEGFLEYRRRKGMAARHEVEEAMTKAVLRYCKQCEHGPFEKDKGCNRIKCPKCGYRHCYACGSAVPEYSDHYGGNNPCPLFEDTKKRLRVEASGAQQRTVREVLEKQPNLREQDVIIDAVMFQQAGDIQLSDLSAPGSARRNANGGRQAANEDAPLCAHIIHIMILICVLGLTAGLLKYPGRCIPLLVSEMISVILSLLEKQVNKDWLWFLNFFLSLSIATAMTVELSKGRFQPFNDLAKANVGFLWPKFYFDFVLTPSGPRREEQREPERRQNV